MTSNVKMSATQITLTGVVALATAVLAGCASGPPKSGFLSDYSTLEELPADAKIWDYVDADGTRRASNSRIWADKRNVEALGRYDKLIIEPVVVQLRPDAHGAWISPAKLNEMAEFVRSAYTEELQGRYPIVDEPGERTLRMRTAITDIFVQRTYDVPDTDRHPAKIWANSTPGGAIIEQEVLDSVTGERLVALVAESKGTYLGSIDEENPWQRPKEAICGAARFARQVMDEMHK